ncbi:MAG: 50S ribosomal protein L4 [Deltaproteobacteria bacterium]|nr:50S ribosomal protein L4 [Deltaproteobacteria bacterium]MBN2844868.1 50S ribosomal protein L4 [Deltaproteobacteria bacterium]
MSVLNVYDIEKNKVAELEVNDLVFGAPINENVLYEVVKMQMAARRSGTASTKGRSEVRGGGRKPWRQKGTGRARAGTIRSPLWRGGGIVFGPKPRSYSFKPPKKVRKAALISALSLKVKEDKILILKDFPMEEIKTKKFKEVLDRFEMKRALFVTDGENPVLEKSSRNIKDVKMMRSEGINVYDLLKYDYLVLLEQSVKKIEGALLS